MHSGLNLYVIDAFISYKKPLSNEQGSEQSEQASERVSATESASKASSQEQANKWEVRVNERTDERVAQYSMRLFLNHLAHRVMASSLKDRVAYRW